METDLIKKYLEEVFQNRLERFGVEEKYIQKIKENIKLQIYSLLYHWKDERFRKAILITGMEEGFFYEPEANIDVKNFVVVAIRNSYLEDIFSVNCQSMGLDKPLEEKLVKEITKEAIKYFEKVDFVKLSNDINKLEIEDIYGNIAKQFPLAWEAFIQLGNCIGKKVIYEKKPMQGKKMTKELVKMETNLAVSIKKHQLKEIESGISEKLSINIINLLKNIIKNKNGIFYTDCFKMISRNLKKLLFIMEVLLENECGLLTNNFLITDCYIGKRTFLLRAAHTTKEMEERIKTPNYNGLSKTHREILEAYIKFIKDIKLT